MQKEVFDALSDRIGHGYFLKESPKGPRAVCSPLLEGFSNRLRHAFSSRLGGVSKGPYESLNLSLKHPENYAEVEENFRRFCKAFSFAYENLCIIHYEHGCTVLPVSREDRQRRGH